MLMIHLRTIKLIFGSVKLNEEPESQLSELLHKKDIEFSPYDYMLFIM